MLEGNVLLDMNMHIIIDVDATKPFIRLAMYSADVSSFIYLSVRCAGNA